MNRRWVLLRKSSSEILNAPNAVERVGQEFGLIPQNTVPRSDPGYAGPRKHIGK